MRTRYSKAENETRHPWQSKLGPSIISSLACHSSSRTGSRSLLSLTGVCRPMLVFLASYTWLSRVMNEVFEHWTSGVISMSPRSWRAEWDYTIRRMPKCNMEPCPRVLLHQEFITTRWSSRHSTSQRKHVIGSCQWSPSTVVSKHLTTACSELRGSELGIRSIMHAVMLSWCLGSPGCRLSSSTRMLP